MDLLSDRNLAAVAAVLDIAANSSATRARAHKPLAAALGLRANPRYLETMLQSLVHAGVLASVRGPMGGYSLAKPAAKISVAYIVAGAEASLGLCVRGSVLPRAVSDKFVPAIEEAGASFRAKLARLTVADLLKGAS